MVSCLDFYKRGNPTIIRGTTHFKIVVENHRKSWQNFNDDDDQEKSKPHFHSVWHYLKPGSRILSKSNPAVQYWNTIPDFGIDLEPFFKELFTIAEGNSTKLEQVFAINHRALLVSSTFKMNWAFS